MGLLEDFGYDEEDNGSYSPDEMVPAPLDAPTDVSALRRGGGQQGELRDAIIATAQKLGIDPLHLATAISYETGGTFDPWKAGPTTQHGQHRGLIQWGEPQARQYGVGPDTPISDQLVAVGRYLTDRGVRPGMGLLDVYSAINAGRVGLYDRSDANNGGAPGTVRDKVNSQMGDHKLKAASLLGALDDAQALGYAPAENASFPGYRPPTGPRRTGSSEGIGYISNNDGGWTPAVDEPPQAMFYGPLRQNTNRTPDYVRSGTPGMQAGYVPPEMRGPFRKSTPQPIVNLDPKMIIGQPTAPLSYGKDFPIDAAQSLPGIQLDEAPPVTMEQLTALLKPSEPVLPVLDESAGLNLAKTASNISIPSTDPITSPEAAPEIPSPVLPNLPPKDQSSLLVSKGNILTDPNPPSVPMSKGYDINPSFLEQELPDNKPAPTSFMDMVNAAINPVKQLGAKAMGAVTAAPFQLGAMGSAIIDQGNNTGGVTAGLLGEAERMKKGADFAFGVPEKGVTIGDKLGSLAGQALMPAGRNTFAMSGLNAAAIAASEMIQGAQAQTMTKKQAEKLMFPGIGNNAAGSDVTAGPLAGPRVTHTVQTAGGPVQLDDPNFRLLGYMGAATIGALAMPAIARRVLSTPAFSRIGRLVEDSPGVEAFTNRIDLVRMADDKFAPIMRVSRDLGVHPIALDEMQKVFDFATGSGARNLTNSAVVKGTMEHPNFSYRVATPIAELAKVETPEITQYMHLWHTLDEIKNIENSLSAQGATAIQNQVINAGHVTVRGMTKYDVNQAIRTFEASPLGQQLKDYRTAYLDNQKTLRNFEAQGEYGMYTKQELRDLNRREANKVYQKDLAVGNTTAEQGAVADAFAISQTERMRLRMENEAKGLAVDNLAAANPNAAKRIEPVIGTNVQGNSIEFKSVNKVLEENPNWKKNLVTFKRRGEVEHWAIDPMFADILKMDPYMASGGINSVIQGTRRLTEATTTGVLAPWFSTTSMIRNHMLIRQSASAGFVPPNMLQTAAAIPQQLYARMADDISQRLNHWSQGWLGQVMVNPNQKFGLPGGNVGNGLQSLSTKLAQVYDQSTYAALSQRGGVHTSMFLNYNQEAAQSIQAAMASIPHGVSHTALSGLQALFEAIHGSANFAYARKNINRGVAPTSAAMEARAVTGNNTKAGQLRTRSGQTIRFADIPDETILGQIGTDYAYLYGQLHEAGRQSAPWWNVTTQGMKAVGKAYMDNPARFVGNAYLYQIMPAAAVWFYNRGLGTDPNGVSYTDYQMNRRTGYDSLMNMYIALPGKPAEQGIKIPLPHEMAVFQSMISAAMHHMTHTGVYDRPDDFMRTALSLVGKDYKPSMDVPVFSAEQQLSQIAKKAAEVALIPAAPPMVSMVAAAGGFVMPEGPFGGAYKKKEELNDQNGMNASHELMMRALAPGLADIVYSGFAGFTQTEDEWQKGWAAVNAMGKKTAEKMPLVRDVTGWKPPVTGSTRITSEAFEDNAIFKKMDQWYKNRDPDGPEASGGGGGSKEGRIVTDMFMPKSPGESNLGQNKASPNQLYQAFMEELHAKLSKDTITERGKGKEASGGIGMKSHWKRYAEFTDIIKDVKNHEQSATWERRIDQEEGLKKYLTENRIDYRNPRLVRNFLEHERQTAARQIMFTMRAIEQDFGKRIGDGNFKFEKLDPMKPTPLPPGFEPQPFVPQLPPYWMGRK